MLIPREMEALYFLLKGIAGEPATLGRTKLLNKGKSSGKLG